MKGGDYCFRKPGGLRLDMPGDQLVEVYKRKSRSALNMLDSAKNKQEYDWILDTSYYAKYFMVYALFAKAGIKSEIHDCTIFGLKAFFVDEGLVSVDILKELEKSKDLRVGALYYDKDFGKEAILKRAAVAGDFCLKVEQVLESLSKEDVQRIRDKFVKLSSK